MTRRRAIDPATMGEFGRFLLTGAGATALHYAVLVALVQAGACGPVAATTIGFVVGATVNYFMSARYSFRSDASHADASPRFAAVALSGLALNALVMWVLNGWLHLPYVVAQVGATGVTIGWNFLLNKHWTFSKRTSVGGA
jgi:putative flippase GtrA